MDWRKSPSDGGHKGPPPGQRRFGASYSNQRGRGRGRGQGWTSNRGEARPASNVPVKEYDVGLVSNCYPIKLTNEHLDKTMFLYEIILNLVLQNQAGDDVPLPAFIKRMTDNQKVSKELRRKIVESAIGKWMAANQDPGRFLRCDLNCYRLLANFDLGSVTNADELVDVPFHQGNLQQSTLKFAIQLKKIEARDLRNLLNMAIGVDGRANPALVQQYSTHTVKYNTTELIRAFFADGIRMLRGQTVRMKSTSIGPALTISNSTGLFYQPLDRPQRLVDYVKSYFKITDLSAKLDEFAVRKLSQKLSGRQVEISYSKLFGIPRQIQACKISGSANDPLDSDQEKTIREYFKEKNGIELEYPHLPCVVLDKQGRHKIPLELCNLVEAAKVTRELYPNEQSEMTMKSTLRPEDYFEKVESHSKLLIESNRDNLAKIGASIDPQPIKVTGQVLAPIWLLGGGGEKITPNQGQYNARRVKFLRPIKLNKLCITLIGIANKSELDNIKDNQLAKFITEYCNQGRAKGVQIDTSMVQVEIIIDQNEHRLKEKLKRQVEQLNKDSVDHSIMVLPEDCSFIYSYVQFLETQCKFEHQDSPTSGRRTRLSCLLTSNLIQILKESEDRNCSFLENLWLKINAELGGINYVLKSNCLFELPGDDFLVLGVDVCHPSRNDKLSTSIAAADGLWSVASEGYSHSVQLRAQPTRCETKKSTIEQVIDIGLMVEGILNSYARRMNGKLPSKILILRDGVSEGQFKMVETYELDRIRQMLAGKYSKAGQPAPLISCFIIQKRHDVRFKLSSPVQVRGRDNYQMPPGTIVDSQIVSPNGFSFYSAPQNSPIGTARPPLVTKLIDEIRLSDRDYQRLILALCFLSPRCTKSTSVPTPIDLADLAAERGKYIAVEWAKEHGSGLGSSLVAQLNQYFANMGDDYLDTMFYV